MTGGEREDVAESTTNGPIRSLADDLRLRSDADLVALLTDRPDLARPVPDDFAALANRAAGRSSVLAALARLDTPTLQVSQALVVLGSATPEQVAAACGATLEQISSPLRTLHRLALIWGQERLRPVRALTGVHSPYPAGLGPSLTELGLAWPARIPQACRLRGITPTGEPVTDLAALAAADPLPVLAEAPAQAVDLVRQLATSWPAGHLTDADRDPDPPRTVVDWLLIRMLVVATGPDEVVLPAEVGIAVRGRVLTLSPPPVRPSARLEPTRVDAAGAAAATEVVRHVQDLVRRLDREPVPLRRQGGVGARDLTRLARDLGVDAALTALLLESAAAAGLIAVSRSGDQAVLMASTLTEDLRAAGPAPWWAHLARGWLQHAGSAGLVGSRDDRNVLRAALSAAVQRDTERQLRRAVLEEFATAPAGTPHTEAEVFALLQHNRPRSALMTAIAALPAVLHEASTLGILGLAALTSFGARLLTDEPLVGVDPAATALAAVLPTPGRTVLVQADLTAIAPGPLEPDVADLLDGCAEVESRGSATVYRFTSESVRRGLDAGADPDGLLRDLTTAADGVLPQPLEYLIGDVARRHGRLRVGVAGCYLRCPDPDLLAAALAEPRLTDLGLHPIADTVLISALDPATVLARLRAAGFAPMAEGLDGTLVDLTTAVRSRPEPALRATSHGPQPHPTRSQLAAGVRRIRQVEHVLATAAALPSGARPPRIPRCDPATAVTRLLEAARDGRSVWISRTDEVGAVDHLLVHPLGVDGGRATVIDRGRIRVIGAHRLVGVQPVGTPPGVAGEGSA